MRNNLVNTSLGYSGYPANLFWNQRTQSSDVANHRSAFYSIRPQDAPFNDLISRTQSRNRPRNAAQQNQSDDNVNCPADTFLAFYILSLYVHNSSSLWDTPPADNG